MSSSSCHGSQASMPRRRHYERRSCRCVNNERAARRERVSSQSWGVPEPGLPKEKNTYRVPRIGVLLRRKVNIMVLPRLKARVSMAAAWVFLPPPLISLSVPSKGLLRAPTLGNSMPCAAAAADRHRCFKAQAQHLVDVVVMETTEHEVPKEVPPRAQDAELAHRVARPRARHRARVGSRTELPVPLLQCCFCCRQCPPPLPWKVLMLLVLLWVGGDAADLAAAAAAAVFVANAAAAVVVVLRMRSPGSLRSASSSSPLRHCSAAAVSKCPRGSASCSTCSSCSPSLLSSPSTASSARNGAHCTDS